MFPQLRERFGSALDLVVEFSTLGEYRLGADGAVCPAGALTPHPPEREPQLGGAGDHPLAAQAAVRRIVAGGAAGKVPVATPAARRLDVPRRGTQCQGARRRRTSDASAAPARRPRPGAPPVAEQLCLAL
jgi:RIP homotypic interaction motif